MRDRSVWLMALARHAAERPGAVAVEEVAPDGEISRTATWGEFVAAVALRASTLSKVVAPGATVLAAWPSGIELATWFAGAVAAGTRLVMMHPRSGAGECAAVCVRTGVQAALATEALLERVDGAVARIEGEVVRPQLKGDHREGAAVLLCGTIEPGSIVLGSSGTTGLPKLVVRESAALDADARAVAAGMLLTIEDRVLCIAPLCHSYGVDVLLGTLFAGATLRIMPEFDPVGLACQLTNGVTVLPGLPFVYESLSLLPGGSGGVADGWSPAHRLRLAVSAGSPLNARVREKFTERYKIDVGQLYGATELGTVSLSIPGELGFDVRSVGRPLRGVSFRVVDAKDPSKVLGIGEEGELAVKAPSMLSGYIGEELSLVEGHLLTGDLARLDRDGRATITGRLKLMIDAGGFKVNPLEVEATLLQHPNVADCAVMPLAMSNTIHRLSALVVARDAARPPEDADLRRFLRERLAPMKIPRNFEVVASLPRSPTGKLLRDQLRKRGTDHAHG